MKITQRLIVIRNHKTGSMATSVALQIPAPFYHDPPHNTNQTHIGSKFMDRYYSGGFSQRQLQKMTFLKIYRRPFKDTISISEIWPGAICLFLLASLFWGSSIFTAILILEFCVLLFCVAWTAIQLFYVIVTDDAIEIKNPVYFFWGGTYRYCDIKKVEIGYFGGFSLPFIRIITSKKKSWRYVMDLVDSTDYADLIQNLQQHGFEVEIINMDRFLNTKK